jgi:hypothetical protein
MNFWVIALGSAICTFACQASQLQCNTQVADFLRDSETVAACSWRLARLLLSRHDCDHTMALLASSPDHLALAILRHCSSSLTTLVNRLPDSVAVIACRAAIQESQFGPQFSLQQISSNLSVLRRVAVDILPCMQELQSLKLCRVCPPDPFMDDLARNLARLPTLSHMEIQVDMLPARAFSAVVSGLPTLQTLRALAVCNPGNTAGRRHLGTSIVLEALPLLTGLQSLHLSNLNMGSTQARHLSSVLAALPALTELKVSEAASCLRDIAFGCATVLKRLELRWPSVSACGASHVPAVLRDLSGLQSLSISGCLACTQEVAVLTKTLAGLSALTCLQLVVSFFICEPAKPSLSLLTDLWTVAPQLLYLELGWLHVGQPNVNSKVMLAILSSPVFRTLRVVPKTMVLPERHESVYERLLSEDDLAMLLEGLRQHVATRQGTACNGHECERFLREVERGERYLLEGVDVQVLVDA